MINARDPRNDPNPYLIPCQIKSADCLKQGSDGYCDTCNRWICIGCSADVELEGGYLRCVYCQDDIETAAKKEQGEKRAA